MKLTEKQIEKRGDILNHFIQEAGVKKTEEWMNDPKKLDLINALAASLA